MTHAARAATPALWEREEAKSAPLIILLAAGLQRRGLEETLAVLAARTSMAAFGYAAQAWFEDPSFSLGILLERAFSALRALSVAD